MFTALESFNTAWLPMLLDATIKGAALLVLAGIAVSCIPRTSAAMRHAVWLMAMVGLLLLPLMSIALPGLRVLPEWCSLQAVGEVATPEDSGAIIPSQPSDLASEESPIVRASPSETLFVPSELPVDGYPEAEAPIETAGVSPSTEFLPAPAVEETFAPVSPSVSPSVTASETSSEPATANEWSLRLLVPWLTGIWLLGFVVTVLPTILGRLSLWWLERKARPIVEGPWVELLKRTADELGIRRKITLIETDRCSVPMTAGSLRPRLIVPSEFSQWTPDRRQVVMLHELGHVRRWDCLTKLVVQLASALYWFNPVVWLAKRWTHIEAERACDDLVREPRMLRRTVRPWQDQPDG